MKKTGIEGDLLSRENRQQIELYFNQFLPRGKKRVIRENIQGAVVGVATSCMQQSSTRSGGLAHEAAVFVSEDFELELNEQNLFVIKELTGQPAQQTFNDSWLLSPDPKSMAIQRLKEIQDQGIDDLRRIVENDSLKDKDINELRS